MMRRTTFLKSRVGRQKAHSWQRHHLFATLFILGLVVTLAILGNFAPIVAHATATTPTEAHGTGTFTNPISPTPDPFMTYYNGQYYLIISGGDNTIRMRSAASIGSLYGVTPQVIWTENDPSRNQDIWAPAFFTFNDHWYVYWTGDDGNVGNHRMQVLESDGLLSQGATPNSSYHFKSTLNDPANNVMGIDGVPFVHNNQMYFVWAASYCCGFDTLRLSTMSNPFTLSGTSVALNVDSCEGVAEAPSTIHRNGRTWLVYSVCDTGKPEYQLKMESINDGADPLNPGNWQDWGTVFQSNPGAGVWSVGSNGFFQSPDGTQDWIVYHGKDTSDSGNQTYSHRITRAQQFTWNSDGSPNFGSPVGLGVPLVVPSGDPGTGGVPVPGTYYKIINQNSGKVIAVNGMSLADGAQVTQWNDNGTPDHNWQFVSIGGGYYHIINQYSGKLLAVSNMSQSDGADVTQWNDNGTPDHNWQLVDIGNGYYHIVNQYSGKLLAVSGMSQVDGAYVTQWNDNGTPDHNWQLTPA